MIYRFLAAFLRLLTRVFFRQIEVVGREHIPARGPVIFVGNHPNSLLDPACIISTCGRKVHFAAADILFKVAPLRVIFRGLGAVPIARRADHQTAAGQKVDNDAAFAAMFDVLVSGHAVGIFPEGISHDEAQLQTLKTGAARIALGAAARAGGQPIAIVPCGLTFVNRKRFRSRALIQYGPPITVQADDDPEATRRLTREIERHIRALTINADDWETIRTLDVVRRLYQPDDISMEDRIELARRFNAYYPAVKDDPRVVAFLAEVRAYRDRLDATAISDRELARDVSSLGVTSRLLAYFGFVLFWLPMVLPGLPLHLVAAGFARFAGWKLTPRRDVIGTTKVIAGLGMVLVLYGLAVGLAWWRWGPPWGLGALFILPLSGYATLRVIDRLHLMRRGMGVLARRLQLRREVFALRDARADLVRKTAQMIDAVRPADVTPLFPERLPR